MRLYCPRYFIYFGTFLNMIRHLRRQPNAVSFTSFPGELTILNTSSVFNQPRKLVKKELARKRCITTAGLVTCIKPSLLWNNYKSVIDTYYYTVDKPVYRYCFQFSVCFSAHHSLGSMTSNGILYNRFVEHMSMYWYFMCLAYLRFEGTIHGYQNHECRKRIKSLL